MGDRMLVCVRMAAGLLLVLLCTLLAQAKGNSDGLNDGESMYYSLSLPSSCRRYSQEK